MAADRFFDWLMALSVVAGLTVLVASRNTASIVNAISRGIARTFTSVMGGARVR